MSKVIEEIRQELILNADDKTKNSGKRFFKEAVNLHGVKTSIVSRISKAHFQSVKGRDKNEVFGLCDELWESGYLEESFIACDWAYFIRERYEHQDFEVFEKWVGNYISNWASCDTLCNHAIGAFVEIYPEYLLRLKDWARSENRWVRRAAAVTLIVPAKEGKFLKDIFEIADILLLDKDDLVQKGYGWMLKEASRKHQNEVYEYVVKHKMVMPRTALRYAIEKMPEELRKSAMQK